MQDEFSVNIYEEVVRFHLLSEHELCEEEASSKWPACWLAACLAGWLAGLTNPTARGQLPSHMRS
jgi:hypothetical protein